MWHYDPEAGSIWTWCNKCSRGYSIYQYCALAGLSLREFLNQEFDFQESKPNEVQKMDWPRHFIPLSDEKAQPGLDYLASRKIDPDDGMYYDTSRKGIVFPYFYEQTFVGAQIRLIEPWIDEDGGERKIDTMPGTRLGLLFYNWNQDKFLTDIKAVVVTEGAFNALAIQQALNKVYGGHAKNPWRVVAASGSGSSSHQIDALKALKEQGLKIVLAPDSDKAGMKMLKKFHAAQAMTHYVLTGDSEIDWNDASYSMGKKEFAKWFLRSIKHVKYKTEDDGQDKEASR
jgi:hypothetical protein